MGLLAPLYALAALAIAGPIVFHLIRRQPQGQVNFSSLMFLSPSPPRLTRRSRLDNLFLLLLRALAIGLIAFAFARPYLRQESFLNTNLSDRNIVVLLDTSGSMQRESVWSEAQAELDEVIASLSSGDRLSLYTIDDEVTTVVGFDGDQSRDGQSSQEAVRVAVKQLQPTWKRTELAEGLRTVADLLNAALISGKITAGTATEVVLISDLHTESGLESLQGYPWPQTVRLDVRRILPAKPGNARPSLMASADDTEDSVRVRIENNANSERQAFELVWASDTGPVVGSDARAATSRVQVPAGQVRVIPMLAQPTGADRISLLGDAWKGDNDVFVIETEPELQRVAFVGTPQNEPEQDLGYFLEKAPLSTSMIRRNVEPTDVGGLALITQDPQVKTVILEPLPGLVDQADSLREFARRGGVVLICLSRANGDPTLASDLLARLFGVEGVRVSEARLKDYAMFGSIDYSHPVFAPFADPKYNDFSKIRFWSHRRVELPTTSNAGGDDTSSELAAGLKVVTRFDNESPMLVQQSAGQGTIWLLTAGWHPEGSGLGLSSKFVPILMGMLDPSGQAQRTQLVYEVGENVPVPGELQRVLDAQGSTVEPPTLVMAANGVQLSKPGIFELVGADFQRKVAIQLPASESRLLPLDSDVFEQYGIELGVVKSESQRREAARQMQVAELEGQQRLWQWLIAAGIVVLAVETLAAGWLSRKQVKQMAAPT